MIDLPRFLKQARIWIWVLNIPILAMLAYVIATQPDVRIPFAIIAALQVAGLIGLFRFIRGELEKQEQRTSDKKLEE